MRKIVSHEEFVRAWLTCGDVSEVAKTTRLKIGTVRFRAWQLRKAGVALPRKKRGIPRLAMDVVGLNRLVKAGGR